MERDGLHKRYFELGNELPDIYPSKSFQNHCYWRIALDQVISDKWNHKLDSPAYKNLSDEQLQQVIELLEHYKDDEVLLEKHNKQSLRYRGKV
ncbi:acetyltransferase [Nonlabens ponticola]|uniref:Acetyltransferase n=1 Tax=Nonlabens ponticola TaxID=2496866 RepID=A0A3S9MVD1_9FLAO|nr:acetyltransferase [Nonlabens ponticola]AZQ43155.1 acetyltransferase [Nonlabens ponticola]